MKTRIPKKYLRITFLLAFAVSLTIHFNLFAGVFFDDLHGHHNHTFSTGFILFQSLVTFGIAVAIFLSNYPIFKPFNTEHKISYKTVIVSTISSLAILSVCILLAIFIRDFLEINMDRRRNNEEMISRNLFCTLAVILSIVIIRFIHQKQTVELEVEQLRTQGLQSQLESLKNQMSPHFLFNSLTALKTLIEEAPETASTYINHLSQVLRHSLQSHKKELVTLDEELNMTRSYIFLLKIRYGSNLSVETQIDKKYKFHQLPPLTIQNLVENAVKHNEISKEHGLKITIRTLENGNIEIKNNIQKKLTPEEGTGFGLTNLIKLYRLLGENNVQIFQDQREFRVEVPLLKPKNYESADN
jgi:sensor histidine kinase YesM